MSRARPGPGRLATPPARAIDFLENSDLAPSGAPTTFDDREEPDLNRNAQLRLALALTALVALGPWAGAHAAYAVRELLKTPKVVPIHYGTFPPLKGTPEEFKAALGDAKTEVIVMQPGEERKF